MLITSEGLEEYIADNNPSMQISKKEAIARKAIPVSREFTFGKSHIDFADSDIYSFYGNCSLEIEAVFSQIFMDHQIVAFVPYRVTQVPTQFGIKFKVDTLVVLAKAGEWR